MKCKSLRQTVLGLSRRGFLKGACAAAAYGLPVRIWGADDRLARPDLVLGILSDIHISVGPTTDPVRATAMFRHALEYFRDRHVDGVLISGDLANLGLVTELKAVADAWFSVFPDGKLPDGSSVANLMHYGDHDAESRFYSDRLKATFKKAGQPVPQSLSQDDNGKTCWEKFFREPWSSVRHVRVKGYDFILSNFTRNGASAPKDLEERLREMKLDPDKPFFYSQHRWIRGTYLADEGMKSLADNGVTHKVLPKFPNAIALQGHTHYMLTDDRIVWIGPFISIATGSLLEQCPAQLGENGMDYSWVKTDPLRDSQMPCLAADRGHGGLVMSLRGDIMTIERIDFGLNCHLGPDLVFSINPKARSKNSDEARKANSPSPEFAHGARVEIAERQGKDRQGRVCAQVVVSFPTVKSGKGRPRALSYSIRAEEPSGRLIKEKRVYSPGINLPEDRDERTSACVFAKSEIGCEGPVRFVVRPANCWGVFGRSIAAEARLSEAR